MIFRAVVRSKRLCYLTSSSPTSPLISRHWSVTSEEVSSVMMIMHTSVVIILYELNMECGRLPLLMTGLKSVVPTTTEEEEVMCGVVCNIHRTVSV